MSILAELFAGRRGLRVLSRRSIENPSVPLNSMDEEDWETYGLTSGKADSGVRVNPQTALTCSEFWRGINLISSAVAKTSIHLYERQADGGRDRVRSDPRYRLMRRSPNAFTNAYNFKSTLEGHKQMCGNGYAYIFRSAGGDPLEVLQLNPYNTYPVRKTGKLTYLTHVGGNLNLSLPGMRPPGEPLNPGEVRELPAADVLHIRGLGFDGLVGYDVIRFAKESLGLSLGMRKFSAVFFKNGAHIGVVLEHPGELDVDAMNELRRSWENMHSGLDNAHKTAILEEGMKAHVLAMDARKAQLTDLREIEVRAIANFLGLPPHKLGDTTRTAFASLEQENQAVLDDCYDPCFCQWEHELNDKLLTEEEKTTESKWFEFNRDEIVRVDYKTQREGLTLEINNGMASLDEARAKLNRPPLPDGAGSQFRMPMNHEIIRPPQADDGGAADELAFMRQVVLAYIADGTISDVMFNKTDAGRLLEEVNIPTEPDYTEPWLPVIADNGEPVTGEVVTDEQGDIVGGSTEGTEPEPEGGQDLPDDQTGQDDQADEEEAQTRITVESQGGNRTAVIDVRQADGAAGAAGIDVNDPASVRRAYEQIRRLAAARRVRAMVAAERVWREAWRRLTVRIAHQAERAAARPGQFVAFVDQVEQENERAMQEIIGPVYQMIRTMGAPADARNIRRKYFAWLRGELLRVAECKPAELAAAVKRWADANVGVAV